MQYNVDHALAPYYKYKFYVEVRQLVFDLNSLILMSHLKK